jgi:hypothetical protein
MYKYIFYRPNLEQYRFSAWQESNHGFYKNPDILTFFNPDIFNIFSLQKSWNFNIAKI